MEDPVETKLRKAAQDCLDAMETAPDDVVGAASALRLRAMLAAVEIDRLRAERDAASLWATTHRHFGDEVERVVSLWREMEAGGGTGGGINCQLADSRRIGARLATAAEALLASLREAAPVTVDGGAQ